MLIGLIRPLSANESAEDTIRGRHPGTNVRQNGVVLILLALFIPWNQLPEKFHSYRALLGTYRNYYWNIWKNAIGGLEEYAQYAAKNILQIKKSQLDAKLDRNWRNAAKNRQARMWIYLIMRIIMLMYEKKREKKNKRMIWMCLRQIHIHM